MALPRTAAPVGAQPVTGLPPVGAGALAAPEATTAPLRVLLIEDNDLDAFLLAEMLLQQPHLRATVERANDLESGLQRLSAGGIDLVLLDLSLPDSAELETFRTLESAGHAVPTIVCSASDDAALGVEAVRLGAQDYLVKGQVTPDGLTRAIRYSMERHRMLAALRGLSLVDELTGLYNRRGFLTLAQSHITQAARAQRRFVLVMADLDGLKPINDTYGHADGDGAIRLAADVLRQSFRSTDVLARLGGDEYAVLALETHEGSERAMQARVEAGLQAANASGERPYRIGMSMGLFPFAADGRTPLEELMARADQLLYEQKRSRPNRRLQLL